jgi:hypothetical protein
MPIEGLPPVTSTQVRASVSAWVTRLVSPLGSSAMSANGMMEVADRVKYILVVILLAVIVYATKHSHLLGRVTGSGATPTPPGGSPAGSGAASASSVGLPVASGATSANPVESSAGSGAASTNSVGSHAGGFRDGSLTLSGIIGDDDKRIDAAFDVLLGNLESLRGDAGRVFGEQVQQFYRIHGHLRADPNFAKAFVHVEQNERNYQFLLEMKGAVFFPATYSINNEGVVPLPQDGNCLFHALGAGLHLLEPEMTRKGVWNNFSFDHATIRKRVTDWMDSNLSTDAELKVHIDRAIMEYCPILEEQQRIYRLSVESVGRSVLNDDDYQAKEKQLQILRAVQPDAPGTLQAHQLYLEMTRAQGKFASSPQMYAFCRLNPDVGIRVAKTLFFPGRNGAADRREVRFDSFLPFNPGAKFVIKPHFNEAGNHFDLNVTY